MGRPLRNDINGVDVRGSYANPNAGIRCDFYDASLRTDGVVVKQRGAKTFVVTRISNLGDPNIKDSTSTTTAVLVSGEPAAAGEMRILGATDDQVPGTVAIAKLTKRVATDFSGNRYTWFLENDSTADVIRLTAI
jgi:hypothetical protein